MSQKAAAKMTVWAWNSSHLDSFLAFALRPQSSFLFLASEFHFGHFFFPRINSFFLRKHFALFLGCWLLVNATVQWSETSRSTFTDLQTPGWQPLTSASYPMFSPPLGFSSSLSSTHNTRNRAFATRPTPRSKKHLCRRLSRGMFVAASRK